MGTGSAPSRGSPTRSVLRWVVDTKKAKEMLNRLDNVQELVLNAKQVLAGVLSEQVPEADLEAEGELVSTLDRLNLAGKSLERAYGCVSQFAR